MLILPIQSTKFPSYIPIVHEWLIVDTTKLANQEAIPNTYAYLLVLLAFAIQKHWIGPVSYTHLTLPTKA